MPAPAIIDSVTDSDAAEQAFREGRARFRKGQRVVVRPREGGPLQVVDASEVSGRLETGWALATKAEADHEARRQRSGEGLGNELAATALGGVRAASLGTSDLAVRIAGGDEAAQKVSDLQEFNPGASSVGEIATDVGIGLLSGGTSALAKGGLKAAAKQAGKAAIREGAEAGAQSLARRALAATPAGLAAKAATLAEGQVARGTASRAAQLAAAASVEAGLVGAGQALSETALDTSQELTAERALANMARGGAEGLLLGGLTGGALGAGITGATRAARGVARGGRRAADAVAGRLGKGAGADLAVDSARGAGLRKQIAQAEGGAQADTRTVMQRFKDQTTAASREEQVHDAAVRSMRRSHNRAAVAADENRLAYDVSNKPDVIRRLMRDGGGPEFRVRESAAARMAELEDQLQGLRVKADAGQYQSGGATAIRRLSAPLDNKASRFDDVLATTADDPIEEAAGSFQLLDRLKADIGRAQVAAGRGANASMEAVQDLNAIRNNLQQYLEDASVWGDGVADAQRTLNKPWSALIDVSASFDRRMATGRRDTLTAIKSKYDPTQNVSEADPQKLGAFLRGLGTAESEGVEDLVSLKLKRELAYQEAAAEVFGAQGQTAKNLDIIREAVAESERTIGEVSRLRADKAAFEESVLRDVPVLGKAQESVGRVASALSRVQLSADSTALRVSNAVQSFLRRASGQAGSKAARVAGATVARAFAGKSRDEQVRKVYEAVEGYESDPAAATRRTQAAAGVQGVAPATAAAMAARGAEVAGLLASKLPRKEPTAGDLYGGTLEGPPDLSESEKDEILAYAQAAMDPMGVVERFERGELSFEDVDALRAAWPGVYSQLRDETIDALTELDAPPPYADRLQLGLLLDIPTDETMEPAFIASIQGAAAGMTENEANAAQQPTLSPSQRSAPDLADQSETKSQRIAR